jgi:uncharacterized protein with HEPN domain
MLSDTEKAVLGDIRYFIDLIGSFLEGYDYRRFAGDLRTFHAITRCLEIISEASRRVPEDIKARYPAIQWRQMAAAGNKYRHEYEDIAQQVVWATVHDALPPLRAIINVELVALRVIGHEDLRLCSDHRHERSP